MKKNILILGHNDATQFIDVYNQYNKLFDKDQYHVTVAILTGPDNQQTRERLLADEIIFFDFSKKRIRGLKIGPLLKLYQLCRQKKFQIVICHRYKSIYMMLWIAQICPIPSLFFVMHALDTLKNYARQCLITCLYRKNMFFVGVSHAVRDDMQKCLQYIPKERVITLYNMIDLELTLPCYLTKIAAREQLNLPQDIFIFGQLARLVPDKDQRTLIHAFAAFKHLHPNAQLVIAGTGRLEAELKALTASYQLEKDILFPGYIENGAHCMRAFDCFVLSSVEEAFGRVLLEAMAAHCPIIATRAHGIPEVVGEHGLLINPGDVAALTHAMKTIYEQSKIEREKMCTVAYEHLIENFSIPTFQKQFWQIAHPLRV